MGTVLNSDNRNFSYNVEYYHSFLLTLFFVVVVVVFSLSFQVFTYYREQVDVNGMKTLMKWLVWYSMGIMEKAFLNWILRH